MPIHDDKQDGSPMEIPRSDYVPQSNTEYNRKQQEISMQNRMTELRANISKAEALIKTIPPSVISMMDLLEIVIKACGGESKVNYLDVSKSFIKIGTRIPLTANLFTFMPESDDNPRFHKVVTKILILSPNVEAIRWLPVDTGALLLVSLKGMGD